MERIKVWIAEARQEHLLDQLLRKLTPASVGEENGRVFVQRYGTGES
jgi:hypothetical protein